MYSLKVPHIKQFAETTCGAAALCMVYWFYGLKGQSERGIWNRLKESRPLNPNQEFIKTFSLLNDAQNHGFHYVYGQAVYEDKSKALGLLEKFLKIGVPIIVCQKFREDQVFGHFRIVVGMDDKNIILNDSELDNSPIKINKEKFLQNWQRCSDEVIGGEFVAILNDDQAKILESIPVNNFRADIKDFEANKLNFNKK